MKRERQAFRYVGGKAHLAWRLVPAIQAHLNAHPGAKIVSLFYGSGFIERACKTENGDVGCEANPDLHTLLRLRASDASKLHAAVNNLGSRYTRVRAWGSEFGASRNGDLWRAARFLWLQSFSYNGLWRVNRKGEHNVPADKARLAKGAAMLPSLEVIESFLRDVPPVVYIDWHVALSDVRRGDLVIADPPYAAGFSAYTAAGFSNAHQLELAAALGACAQVGAAVVAFNAPAVAVWPEYAWARVQGSSRSGRISAGKREPARELILTHGIEV